METKLCKKCGITKPLIEFYNNKKNKDGKDYDCKICKQIQYKQWQRANPEKVREKSRKWKKANPEKVREYKRKWQKANPEKVRGYERNWKKANPEKVRGYERNWQKENSERVRENKRKWKNYQYQNNPLFNTIYKIRRLIQLSISKKNFTKKSRTYEIIGCDYEFFFNHLVESFIKNYGRWPEDSDNLHIDHIIPISTAQTEEEILKLNHYTNLQWLLAEDNLKKSDKLDWELDCTI